MERKLYYFIACVISILFAARGFTGASLGLRDVGDKSSVVLPLVKYGAPLSASGLWSIQRHGSMVGIIDGTLTDILDHPFQIAIDNNQNFVCAGALLNRIWAISLASCIEGAKASTLTVRSGSNSNIYGGTVFNVSELVVHPSFNYSSMDYDFALLKLNTYICYDKKTEAIEFSVSQPKDQYDSIISGWGTDQSKATNKFRQLNMTIIDNSKCQKKYNGTQYKITDRMFCATAGKKGPCYNDFGDPLVVNGTLYGLYSWSVGCANPDYPAVFNNVANVSEWIHSTMNNACLCGVM